PPTPNFQHTLFSAGGHYRPPLAADASYNGFSLFGVGDRLNVRVFPTPDVLFTPPLPMIPTGPAHVALTVKRVNVDGVLKYAVTLFLLGKQAVTTNVNAYFLPIGAALYVGVINNTPDNDASPQPTTPVLAKLQEVVLYRGALADDVIDNHANFRITKA